MSRRRASLRCSIFLGLLLLGQLQFVLSTVGVIIWWSILSWDNPATHDFENTALAPTNTDPASHVRDYLIASATSSHRCILPLEGPGSLQSLALSFGITRSPPAA